MRTLFVKLGITDIPSFMGFVKQFVKFCAVGVSNTVLGLVIYYSLLMFGIYYLLANIIAGFITVMNAYYWNRKYVFKKNNGSTTKQFVKMYASSGFIFLLGMILLFIIVEIFGFSEFIAPLLSLCVMVPLNFLLNKFWVFKS